MINIQCKLSLYTWGPQSRKVATLAFGLQRFLSSSRVGSFPDSREKSVDKSPRAGDPISGPPRPTSQGALAPWAVAAIMHVWPVQGLFCSLAPDHSHHTPPWVDSPQVGVSEQPCVRVCAFPSAIHKVKFPGGFSSWRSILLAFRSPCNTHFFLHAWKWLFPRNCAGEIIFNGIQSHSLFAHVPISSLLWATFCLNHRLTCRASPLSTSKRWVNHTVPEDNIFKDKSPHWAYSLVCFE